MLWCFSDFLPRFVWPPSRATISALPNRDDENVQARCVHYTYVMLILGSEEEPESVAEVAEAPELAPRVEKVRSLLETGIETGCMLKTSRAPPHLRPPR